MNLHFLKSGLLLATVCMSMSAMAQKRSINTAEFALESGNPDDLIIAIEEIEKARQNEKTNNAARMWLIRSKVYSTVFDKKGNELIKPFSKMSGMKSAESILKFEKIKFDHEKILFALNCIAHLAWNVNCRFIRSNSWTSDFRLGKAGGAANCYMC